MTDFIMIYDIDNPTTFTIEDFETLDELREEVHILTGDRFRNIPMVREPDGQGYLVVHLDECDPWITAKRCIPAAQYFSLDGIYIRGYVTRDQMLTDMDNIKSSGNNLTDRQWYALSGAIFNQWYEFDPIPLYYDALS